jgi:hypothetical protein
VYIAIETGILKKESIEKFIEELKTITKMLQALVNSLD